MPFSVAALIRSFCSWRGKHQPQYSTAPKNNGWNLKKGGWKAILSFWEGNLWGAMLSFERVGDVELKELRLKNHYLGEDLASGREHWWAGLWNPFYCSHQKTWSVTVSRNGWPKVGYVPLHTFLLRSAIGDVDICNMYTNCSEALKLLNSRQLKLEMRWCGQYSCFSTSHSACTNITRNIPSC